MKKFFNFIFASIVIVGTIAFHPFIELAGYIMGKFGKKPKDEVKNVKSEE